MGWLAFGELVSSSSDGYKHCGAFAACDPRQLRVIGGAGVSVGCQQRNRSNCMNLRHLMSSATRRLLAMGSLMLAAGLQQPVHATPADLSKFRRIEPQFIAALGDPK